MRGTRLNVEATIATNAAFEYLAQLQDRTNRPILFVGIQAFPEALYRDVRLVG